MEKLQLNLSLGSKSVAAAPDEPQFNADWGNLNTINDTSPTIFWASTSGAQTNIANATVITFTGLGSGKLINITFAGDMDLSFVRHRLNAGTIRTGNDQINNVKDNDTLIIGALGPTLLPESSLTGNIIVNNSTDSYVIDTIPFTIEGSGL